MRIAIALALSAALLQSASAQEIQVLKTHPAPLDSRLSFTSEISPIDSAHNQDMIAAMGANVAAPANRGCDYLAIEMFTPQEAKSWRSLEQCPSGNSRTASLIGAVADKGDATEASIR
jgi:hypothetical protein